MRSPACLLTLCLAACVQHCGCLRSRAAADAAVEQAQLPKERQERRASLKRWMTSGLLAAVQSGEQLVPLLFGTGSGSDAGEMLSREEGLAPGCTEEDGVVAKAAVEEWQVVFGELMKEMTDEMGPLAGAGGQPVNINIGDAWAIQKAAAKMQKHLMQKAPGACKDVQATQAFMGGDWGGLLSCVHQATNVSKKCLRCFPRFVHQVGSDCRAGCVNGMGQARTEILTKMRPVIEKMMPSPAEMMGAPPSHDEAVKRAKVLQDLTPEVFKSLGSVAPCVQCARQRTDHLLDCLNVEPTFKEDIDATLKQVEDGLRDGTLINVTGVEVAVPEPAQQAPIPLM